MPSQEQEQRQATRINSLNLSYFCIDENGRVTHQGMGRTLNISTTGVLLEANEDLPLSKTIDMEIAMKNDLIDASGTIIHSTKAKDDIFHIGIHFTKISDTDKETLSTLT